MSRHWLSPLLWSLVLLVLGIFGLLYNFGVFDNYKTLLAYIVAGVLAALGVTFLAWLAVRREHNALVVPGISLLTLAVLLYLLTLGSVQPTWLAALFLAGMAVGYLVLFLSNRRERWWALLQAGTIAVIALVGLGVGVPPENQYRLGTALFGGFALSYLLLFLVGGDRRSLLWALIMAVVLSGLPAHSFTFRGFPPRKSGPRRRFLAVDQDSPHTLIFYESPYRLVKFLEDALAIYGDRPAAVTNDLTKLFEMVHRGRLSELLAYFRQNEPRGEYTVVIAGKEAADTFPADDEDEEDGR
jgi:hypothetical protein